MLRFKLFVAEEHLLSEAAMIASGLKGEGHVSKYLQPEQLKSLSYQMAKDSGGAKKGEKVKVRKIASKPNNRGVDTFHAHITHSSGSSVVPINHLMKPEGVRGAGRNAEKEEDAAVSELHNHIQKAMKETGSSHVTVSHMGKKYKIAGARKVVSGDYKGRKPKADIVLHDHEGKPQIFLSHKAGAKPTQAQNYEGLSAHGSQKQVSDFLGAVKKQTKGTLKSGQSFVRKFTPRTNTEKKFHKDVMFGSEQSSGTHGVHNVHSIAHGKVTLEKKGGSYSLNSDKMIHNDGSFQHKDHPIEFTARYMTDRKDNGINNARIGIAKVGSRPSSKAI
jgi:hypothetical protein